MADTPRLSLPRPTGTDLISQGDDVITEISNTLDNAAMYATDVFASRPSAASLAGRFFYASDTGGLYFSTGSAWLELDSGPGVPVGGSLDYVGDSDPADTRFLLEDGRAISRASYPVLDAIMSDAGYPYGNGNGTSTFNIPDSRGRGSVAPDDMGTAQGAAGRMASNKTLGATGGSETKTLAQANLPAHVHDQGSLVNAAALDHTHSVGSYSVGSESAHTHGVGTFTIGGSGTLTTGTESADHSHSGATSTDGSHTHGQGTVAEVVSGLNSGRLWGTAGSTVQYSTHVAAGSHNHSFTTGGRSAAHTHSLSSHGHTFTGTSAAGSSHTHGFTGDSGTGGAHNHAITGNTGSVGSGTAYNQMHPYVVKNKIIRVL